MRKRQDSDQTLWMRRLKQVFAVRACNKNFSCRGLFIKNDIYVAEVIISGIMTRENDRRYKLLLISLDLR